MPQTALFNEDDASVDGPMPSALALTGQVAQERSLLPPIETIPTEILDTIFTIVHESSEYSLTISWLNLYPLSLPLSQVCSRWRRITHSRPSLWASIFIDADRVRSRKTRHIVKLHLEKAGSHPLRIKLYVRPNVLRSTFGSDVLRMIIPELQRCEEFMFYGDWLVLAKAAHCDSSFNFPHLRALSTNFPSSALVETMESVTPDFRWFLRALKNAPKLATVESHAFVDPEALPFHQLTTVQYRDPLKIAQMAHLLLSCPNLKKLVITSIISDPGPPKVIVHSSLQELSMPTHHTHLADNVRSLAQVSFPALRMLEMDIHGGGTTRDSITPASAVASIIQHFSASLQKVVLTRRGLNVHKTFYRDILHICPNLHCFAIEVHLRGYCNSEVNYQSESILDLIQSLTITDTSQPFLAPKLTKLCVHDYRSSMTTEYATNFLDMVESRSAGIGVTGLTDAVLTYSAQQWDIQPGLNHINDSSIGERIRLLSRKGIRCMIRAICDD
ncbi:hypothetical protein VNI00_013186 [Paramarasmius palmivorus]|uniref:F-box domain-containing protein n=1 Tax=Paramarasmius palmivorus TaxID=297713 RepID=A0AAW0BZ98_9AGAR